MTRTPVLPDHMTAVEITRPGGPEVLQPCTRPIPQPRPGEVLIRVVAAGVNRPDAMQRRGLYPPPPGASDLPGLEVAGQIVALGQGVVDALLGTEVCALVTGGGYAEYCVASAPLCLPIPRGLTMIETASLPETFFTVWTNLFDLGRLMPREHLLVHGGSGGIGVAAIQMARAFGAKVHATAGSAEKCAFCDDLGAYPILYHEEDFVDLMQRRTDGKGADVILDVVGGPYLSRNLECLAPGGRLLLLAVQGGSKAEINLLPVLLKHLTITGSTLRPRSVAEKATIARALREKIWPLLEADRILPIVHSVFPLAEAAAAHALLESGQQIGKIVLSMVRRDAA